MQANAWDREQVNTDGEKLFRTAVEHHHAGRLAEAEKIYRLILVEQPAHPDALHLLGVIAHQSRDIDAAISLFKKTIKVAPGFALAHFNLGNALSGQGRLSEAETSLREAIRLKPGYAEAHHNLATLLMGQGLTGEAEASFRRAIDCNPDLPDPRISLGNMLEARGCSAEAEPILRRAIDLRPDSPEAHNNLGNVLNSLGRTDEAEASLRQAIALKPAYPEALYNLGTMLRFKGELAEAEILLRRATDLRPNDPEIHNNLGTVLKDQGRLDEAQASLRQALALKGDFTKAHSNLVFYQTFRAGVTADDLQRVHCRWDDVHAAGFRSRWGNYSNTRDPERRLRVGYLSPDFREHSVAYFFAPLLENHDPASVEVFLYSDATVTDETTRRLYGLATQWRDTNGLSDSRLADQIRADRIDILVDLAGHTANNRLLVFARRPAPIQFTYLGYPGTTGLSAIQYRITDRWADPPGTTDQYCPEELVRLPGGFLCYEPPEDAPLPATTSPVEKTGYVTFGSFNNRAKITDGVLAAWGSILQSVPGSRLLLKCRSFADDKTCQSCLAFFRARNIDTDRVQLLGPLASRVEHLATYHQIDIGLDTFPYNGTTTTCEALWMGVPVITLSGNTHASRVGSSILHALGLESLITDSLESYLSKARELAHDQARISELHAGLRERLLQSPLGDGPRIARSMEQVFRDGWQRWCSKPMS
ncbi:MAG TPA: tetratricopeptide repeat protein [Gammaproteobacteria bacterium]|nr:tetratricopeptide repeat protein [Gammaproteobacteria bacterium]